MSAQTPGSAKSLGILIGFDGSDHAEIALHWGAVEALSRGLPLTVMTAFTVPRMISGGDEIPHVPEDSLARRNAEDVLERGRQLLQNYPGETSFHVEYGDAAGVLVAHSSDAEVAVVGARGRGGFIGRILGSVSSALPAHANCPTVVVGPSTEPSQAEGAAKYNRIDDRPIVVGMDESRGSKVAALRAAEAAAARHVPLRLVMAIPPLDGVMLWYRELGTQSDEVERRRRELEDRIQHQVQWLSEHFDHLSITPVVADGLPAEVLQEETIGAQLTVVGTRGRGGLASVLLGSTSSGVITHASGPVMVVPNGEDSRLEE